MEYGCSDTWHKNLVVSSDLNDCHFDHTHHARRGTDYAENMIYRYVYIYIYIVVVGFRVPLLLLIKNTSSILLLKNTSRLAFIAIVPCDGVKPIKMLEGKQF